jgi:hypothetical protein
MTTLTRSTPVKATRMDKATTTETGRPAGEAKRP